MSTVASPVVSSPAIHQLGNVDYKVAWEKQKHLHRARVANEIDDTILLLEHPSVYTAGRRTQPEDLPIDGTPVIDVDRGGRITWHGPGQLVGYPIVKLAEPVDVVAYVRRIESMLIAVCGELGLAATRVEGRSGVWVAGRNSEASGTVETPAPPARKIAAIGIRVSQGVTMHGFALNCNPDLSHYDVIVPCGIADAGVTSLTAELDRKTTVDDAATLIIQRLHNFRL